MLKRIKLHVLQAAASCGVSRLLLDSAWRRNRLLILCYHGFARENEHLWDPYLFISPATFSRRLELLHEHRCTVLPLGEALKRLSAGTLPPRSVAITVDDGTYDFYKVAFPAFQNAGYPVTVYLTTYYSEFNRPVFDTTLSYLLWKAGGATFNWPRVLEGSIRLDAAAIPLVKRRVCDYCRSSGLSGRDKDALLAELASRIGFDYEALCSKRLFTLMTPQEVAEVAAAGIDIQLHTHRHRVFRKKEQFLRELDDNQSRIHAVTGSDPRHFCYPSGNILPEFVPWLEEWGATSATTCQSGLAGRASHPMLLPRLVDMSALSETEFTAWITGVAALLPQRPYVPDYWSLES